MDRRQFLVGAAALGVTAMVVAVTRAQAPDAVPTEAPDAVPPIDLAPRPEPSYRANAYKIGSPVYYVIKEALASPAGQRKLHASIRDGQTCHIVTEDGSPHITVERVDADTLAVDCHTSRWRAVNKMSGWSEANPPVSMTGWGGMTAFAERRDRKNYAEKYGRA